MRLVALLTFCGLTDGCRGDDPGIGFKGHCQTENCILGVMLSSLREWALARPLGVYDGAIDKLERVVCGEAKCSPPQEDSMPPSIPLDSIALELLSSSRALVREAGVEVACGLCTERGMRCVCDGHACSPDDMAVDPVTSRLSCGVVILKNQRVLPWGAAVRAINK